MVKSKAAKGAKSKFLRIGLVLSVLLILISAVILLFWMERHALFSKNKHFTLEHINVKSPGWWNGKSRAVKNLLNLEEGKTNLFGLKLNELREKLEKQASIEKVTVARMLPDTLLINITERIPRAFLRSRKSKWVIDSNAVVMSRALCVKLDETLPVILGFKGERNLVAGAQLPNLKPAIDLIMLTKTDYPDFRITAISMKEKDQIIFVLRCPLFNAKAYTVQMPREKVNTMLKVLKLSLVKAKRNSDPRRHINLLFDGNVIFK